MNDRPDPKSLKKLKAALEMIPPQSSPRAAKARADLQAAVERMEREAQSSKRK